MVGITAALSDGRLDDMRIRFDEEARWLIMERGPVMVVCNLGRAVQRLPLGEERPSHIVLASDQQIRLVPGAVELPQDAMVILSPVEIA